MPSQCQSDIINMIIPSQCRVWYPLLLLLFFKHNNYEICIKIVENLGQLQIHKAKGSI